MPAVTEYLRRAVAPRIVVATSRARRAQSWRAVLRRSLGLPQTLELFFAFDDPYAAIAMPGLLRIAEAHKARLILRPLLMRGIDGDPAALQRRAHAITDSRRLAQRDGRHLRRDETLQAGDCAFLAAWTAAAEHSPGVNAFAAEALAQLWFGSGDRPTAAQYITLFLKATGMPAPAMSPALEARLARNHQRLHKLGHWESPAVRVAGEWYFAHERLAQIDAHLGRLGD